MDLFPVLRERERQSAGTLSGGEQEMLAIAREALGDYAQAIVLLRACHGRLEQAERKIEILSGVDANGTPIVREIDDEELSLEDKQEGRGQRRTAPRGARPSGKLVQNTDDEGSLF